MSSLYPIGTRIQDKLDNTGTVIRYYKNYRRDGYVIQWDVPRFGKSTSMIGPNAVTAL